MNLLTKFYQLSHSDRILLMQAWFLLLIIRLAFWLLPFIWWQKLVNILKPKSQEFIYPNLEEVEQVVWAVKVASYYMFGVKCLAQAIAVQIMLAYQGYVTDLKLGVTKKEAKFQAHAWLESQGNIIIGQVQDLAKFTRLPSWELKS